MANLNNSSIPAVNSTVNNNNSKGENQMTNNNNSAKTFRVWFVLMTFVLAGLANSPDVKYTKLGESFSKKLAFDINNLAAMAFAFQLVSPLIASMFPLSIANGINEITGSRIGNFRLDFEDAIWTSKDGKFIVPDVKWERWNAWNNIEDTTVSELEEIHNLFNPGVEYVAPPAEEVQSLETAIKGRSARQMAEDYEAKTKVFSFKAYGNDNAQTKLIVKFDDEKGEISWNKGATYRLNKYIVKVKHNLPFEEEAFICSAVEVKEVIAQILATVAIKKQLKEAMNVLESLVGTVLVSEWEEDDKNTNSYNWASIKPDDGQLVDAQKVLRENEVVAYHTNKNGIILAKKNHDSKTAWVKGCLAEATKAWGFAMPDKTNTKRAFIKDALGVLGVSADGSMSMVDADKGGKFFNRHAMVKHISAEVIDAIMDYLVVEISEDRFAVSYGAEQNSLFINSPLLSLAVGDGGYIVRKPQTYEINKRIDGRLNVDALLELNPEYKAHVSNNCSDRTEQLGFIQEELVKHLVQELEGRIIAPGKEIEFQGQVIFKNDSKLELVFSGGSIPVRAEVLNTECRSIVVVIKTKSTVCDFNYKARGQWFKGMATRNDDVVVEGSDADTIFNDNSVKNRKAMLIRMWASANNKVVSFCKDGEFRFVERDEETKVLSLGAVIDFNEVEKEIKALTKTVVVSFTTTKEEYNLFKGDKEEELPGVISTQSLNDTLLRVQFRAEAIEAPLVYAIELSSVAENFSDFRNVSPIQSAFLATFDAVRETARGTIKKHSAKISKTIEIAQSDKIDAHFNLTLGESSINCCQHKALIKVLTNALASRKPRDLFRVLSQKYPNGFKVSGSARGGRAWNITIPTRILSVMGAFDKTGWSFNETVLNTFAFLLLLANEATCPQLLADYAMSLKGILDGWKKDVATSKKAFTKGCAVFDTHGMKVLANGTAGSEMHNGVSIPVILVDESNPLVISGELKDGDVVFFYRNPMIDLTPAIVRTTKEQSVCGAFTCAVSPSILAWSSQTDNDGDVLWLVPAKQVRIKNIDTDATKVASLMSHKLVGKTLADETMEAFGCDNLYEGIIKPRDEFSVLNPTHKITINIVDEAEEVANHYRVRVGQGYSAMFNAYASFISRSNKGQAFNNRLELQAIKGASFVLYEEWGLAGYSDENKAKLQEMRSLAKICLGKAKAPARSRFDAPSANSGAKELCAEFVAQSIIQSDIEQGYSVVARSTKALAIKEEALANGLFRSLTKGAFSFGGKEISPIFRDSKVDASNPFSEALASWQSFANKGLVIQ